MIKSKVTYLKKLELYNRLDDHQGGKFYAVIDHKVKNHLPQWIQFSPNVFWLKNPEEEKSIETYNRSIEFFINLGIQRDSIIYAFGGGATTDLAGFVAATILRGIDWVAVPTTLLAMIDASLGGKVGLNLKAGKNLVGAFHAPVTVFICTDFLNSLSEKEILSGRGELLKYGFLSREIHELILKKAPIDEIVLECAKFKTRIVEQDFKERGDRVFLNLGHTLGHAFESMLKIPHGLAVAMGMKYLFRLMNQTHILDEWNLLAKSLALPLEKLEISYYDSFRMNAFLSYLENDKKKVENSIRLVLVKDIGSCYIEEVVFKDFIQRIQSSHEFRY